MDILSREELQIEREEFIQNVRLAIETIKATQVSEPNHQYRTREWGWKTDGPAVFLGTPYQRTGFEPDLITLWDALAGFVKLADCLQGCCDHGSDHSEAWLR